MKNIRTFESFLNERKASHYMAELVELLSDVDAMEIKPDDFVDHLVLNYAVDADDAADIFDAYWSLGAKDRFHYNDNQWIKFLNKLGVK